eukprot:3782751-Amphidinium_carterae.3
MKALKKVSGARVLIALPVAVMHLSSRGVKAKRCKKRKNARCKRLEAAFTTHSAKCLRRWLSSQRFSESHLRNSFGMGRPAQWLNSGITVEMEEHAWQVFQRTYIEVCKAQRIAVQSTANPTSSAKKMRAVFLEGVWMGVSHVCTEIAMSEFKMYISSIGSTKIQI